MSKADLDQLRLVYKKAVDEWVDAIRAEEAEAREAYKDALRDVNYGI